MQINPLNKKGVPGLAAVAVLALFALIFSLFGSDPAGLSAEEIVALCAQDTAREACYEREVVQLYPALSVAQVFDIVRDIRARDTSYQFCHVLAHKLGERVVVEDPERWIDAISLNPPDGLCSNGFIHGVIGGRFRAEVLDEPTLEKLLPDFSRACEPRVGWKPTSLDQAICYHGMGHLYMFITDADVPKALSLCEKTAGESPTGDFHRVCREGVFMQIYQPLEPDDFLLIERMPLKPSTTTVHQFCSMFERDEYEGACLRESWPFFREGIMDGSGVERFCSGHPNDSEETSCYETAFSILGRQSLGSLDAAARACAVTPESRRDMCFSRVALAVVEEDKSAGKRAVLFCALGGSHEESCLAFLAQTAGHNFGSDAAGRRSFCDAFSAPWRERCLGSP